MAKYEGTESLLKAALGEFAEYGFRLVEVNDHITELYFNEKKIASYNTERLTIPLLHEGCRNYLKNILTDRV